MGDGIMMGAGADGGEHATALPEHCRTRWKFKSLLIQSSGAHGSMIESPTFASR